MVARRSCSCVSPLTRAEPGGEIRIRVKASGINFAHILARQGLYPDSPKIPCVVGYEVSGTVDTVGPGVEGLDKLPYRFPYLC
jgi:NADPH:quinone reductase-like Zn-dependent oxidoreductase